MSSSCGRRRGSRLPSPRVFSARSYPPLTVPGEPGPVFLAGRRSRCGARHGRRSSCVRAGGGEERLPVTIVKRPFPEERLTLPPAMVTPPKELEERIAREQALAAEIYRTSAGGEALGPGVHAGARAEGRRQLRAPPDTQRHPQEPPHRPGLHRAGRDAGQGRGRRHGAPGRGLLLLGADAFRRSRRRPRQRVHAPREDARGRGGDRRRRPGHRPGRAAPAAPPARTCTSACASSNSGSTRRRSGGFFGARERASFSLEYLARDWYKPSLITKGRRSSVVEQSIRNR